MPVPSAITDLSLTASSNSPAGSETPTDGDNYFRAHAAFIAYLRDRLNGTTAATLITPTITGTPVFSGTAVTWGTSTAHSGVHTFTNGVSVGNVANGTATVLDHYLEGTWTPTWAALSGSNPALGNGTITGTYTRVGNKITAHVILTMGSTTTYGTGEWSFTLPVTPAVTCVGAVLAVDQGASYYVGAVQVGGTTALCYTNSGSRFNATTPHTWANTDTLNFTVTYFA